MVVIGGFVVVVVVTSVVGTRAVVVVSATRAKDEEDDVDRTRRSGADSGIRSLEPQPVASAAAAAMLTSSRAPRLTAVPSYHLIVSRTQMEVHQRSS